MSGWKCDLWSQTAWALIFSCVTLGKLLRLSLPKFLYLWNGDDSSTSIQGCWRNKWVNICDTLRAGTGTWFPSWTNFLMLTEDQIIFEALLTVTVFIIFFSNMNFPMLTEECSQVTGSESSFTDSLPRMTFWYWVRHILSKWFSLGGPIQGVAVLYEFSDTGFMTLDKLFRITES